MSRFPGDSGVWIWLAALVLTLNPVSAQEPDYRKLADEHYLPQAAEMLQRGEYRQLESICKEFIRQGQTNPKWQIYRLQAVERQGRLAEVVEELPDLLEKHNENLPFLAEAHDWYADFGQEAEAKAVLDQVNKIALAKPLKDRSAEELVALGRTAYALGADPNRVMEQFYDSAKKREEGLVATYLAAGNLALKKYDYARAAKEFREGLKQAPQDPDLRFGLAKALFPSDREEALAQVERVLSFNESHVDALLMRAEHYLNSERYDEAQAIVELVEAIQENNPTAWSFQTVIYQLRDNNSAAANAAQAKALESRPENPLVPHLIGRCLSRRYRFAEGSELQRQAIAWDSDFTQAKLQLSSDLLRLGREEEAWKLAEEVHEADPYNVLAYNYTVLRDQLDKYDTLESEHFVIRMTQEDKNIYGDRVVEILEEAREVLCAKYDMELQEATLVQIFAEQQDFAIRTFGELGGAGYLGVCFGTVITMNSPGSGASGFSNWEATLWHEFCHVVTLTATKNYMPRWLSEGISVYEEIQRNPIWGQHMTPQYRARILDGERMSKVAELSSAFLNVQSGEDLMFAYYQSAMVVDFLISKYGQDAFNSILRELAKGTPINAAIAAYTEKMEALEEHFVTFAQEKANAYGSDLIWSEVPDLETRDLNFMAAFLEETPNQFWVRQAYTRALLEARVWSEAAESAQKFIEMLPEYVGEGNGYTMLAAAYRAMGQPAKEALVLRQLAKRDATATPAYQRLLELDLESENWRQLFANSERQLAVNPFIKTAHYCRGCAAQALGKGPEAINSFEKLLKLGPSSPAEINFQLAKLYTDEDEVRAKRHVLDALVDAPRYREAHSLLIQLTETKEPAKPEPAAPQPTPEASPKMEPAKEPVPKPEPKAEPKLDSAPQPAPESDPAVPEGTSPTPAAAKP